MITEVFSKNFKARRKAAGLTQEAIAQKCGVSPQAVSKWETGNGLPDMEMLPLLSDLLDTSIDSLLREDEDIYPKVNALPADDTWRVIVCRGNLIRQKDDFDPERPTALLDIPHFGLPLHIEVWGDVRYCRDITGNLSATGSVSCGNVGCNVTAGGGVSCHSVQGNVTAGGDVFCDAVHGSVIAQTDVHCTAVSGSVEAGGNVNCRYIEGYTNADGLLFVDWEPPTLDFRFD